MACKRFAITPQWCSIFRFIWLKRCCYCSMEYYMQKTYYKTASLISNSCKAIALLAGQTTEVAMLAFEYGKNLVCDFILSFFLFFSFLFFFGELFYLFQVVFLLVWTDWWISWFLVKSSVSGYHFPGWYPSVYGCSFSYILTVFFSRDWHINWLMMFSISQALLLPLERVHYLTFAM